MSDVQGVLIRPPLLSQGKDLFRWGVGASSPPRAWFNNSKGTWQVKYPFDLRGLIVAWGGEVNDIGWAYADLAAKRAGKRVHDRTRRSNIRETIVHAKAYVKQMGGTVVLVDEHGKETTE